MAKRLIYILIMLLAVSGFAMKQGTLVDERDGKTYKTIKLRDQTWMAENLNYNVDSSFCYNNEESNCDKYGRLYWWNAAMRVCPAGWHLPSEAEFITLVKSVGGDKVAGENLKSKKGWNDHKIKSVNVADVFGLLMRPVGFSVLNKENDGKGYGVDFWSSTEYGSDYAGSMGLNYYYDNADLLNDDKNGGFSVRCLKDSQ